MVARNFSLQDLSYPNLTSVPEGENEDRGELLTLQELKPHHLTDISQFIDTSNADESLHQHRGYSNIDSIHDQGFNVYYDLNQDQTNNNNSSCTADIFDGEKQMKYKNSAMTAGSSYNNSHHSIESQQNSQNNNLQMSSESEHQNKGSRKRKHSYSRVSASEGEDDAKSVRTTDENKKANHSEIEKRRRDKMNNFISELSSMIPMCHAMSRKLDKLTVLRMAVQHLKTIRGAVHSYTEGMHKPTFLSDHELKMIILQAAEGFLFVVGCDRGRILYVSESVSDVLNYSQSDLMGQSWFDILHPKDVAKIKEQLSSSDLSPRERLIDAKTLLPVKHSDIPTGSTKLCPGTRRSFFCRMKCKSAFQIKEENDSTITSRKNKKQHTDKRYCVIQCTGYLKSWPPTKNGGDEQESETEGECNLSLSCLVAVGRIVDINKNSFVQSNFNEKKPCDENEIQTNPKSPASNKTLNENLQRNFQFTSRHAMDGKYSFVDQRATLVLGFLPQELLGTNMYEYFKPKDIASLAESHKDALQSSDSVTTPIYGLRTKHNGFISVQSEWKSFRNPWTKEVEFLIAKNNVIFSDLDGFDEQDINENNFDFFNQSNGHNEFQRMINTHIEASKIGSQIAEQVLDHQRRMGESSDSSPDPGPFGNIVPENLLNASFDISESAGLTTITRVNGSYGNSSNYQNRSEGSVGNDSASSSESSEQAVPESNDDAAMAVIMSLLEADAGLGGPIDCSGLPWPLP